MTEKLLSVLALAVVLDVAMGLRCDYKGYKDITYRYDETAEAFNTLAESWYLTNKQAVSKAIKDSVNLKLMDGIPDWMLSLEVTDVMFPDDSVPAITRIRTDQDMVRCLNEANQVVKLRRVTYDLDMMVHSKKAIAHLAIKLPLGVSAELALNSVELLSQARLELLFSTQEPFPGVVSAYFSFSQRPRFSCNVDLYGLIGIDTFGLDKWANAAVEDIIQKQLVFPGMLFVDFAGLSSGKPVQTNIVSAIHGDFEEWPVAYSVAVRIAPINGTQEREFEIKVTQSEDTPSFLQRINNKGKIQFDSALESLADAKVHLEITEDIRFSLDPVILSKEIDLNAVLVGKSMKESYSYAHYENGNGWKIDVDAFAYMLPPVGLEYDPYTSDVVHYSTFASQASCNSECPQLGVLFVYLHNVLDLSPDDHDGSVDPIVNIYLNDQPILKSKVVSPKYPVFDEKFQVLLRSRDPKYPELSSQTLRFDVEDYDKFTENDFVARTEINLSTEPIIYKTLTLRRGQSTTGHGTLTVSIIFKPVPFFK